MIDRADEKCAIRDCRNRRNEGEFRGPVCFPCYANHFEGHKSALRALQAENDEMQRLHATILGVRNEELTTERTAREAAEKRNGEILQHAQSLELKTIAAESQSRKLRERVEELTDAIHACRKAAGEAVGYSYGLPGRILGITQTALAVYPPDTGMDGARPPRNWDCDDGIVGCAKVGKHRHKSSGPDQEG